MHLLLKDGTRLNHIGATGKKIHAQDVNRDSITFIFDDSHTYDELDSIFTEANCEVIDIVTEAVEADEEGNEVVVLKDNYHYGFVIKHEISKKITTTNGVSKTEFHVTMAQRTYAETQLANLQAQNDLLAECILELSSELYA